MCSFWINQNEHIHDMRRIKIEFYWAKISPVAPRMLFASRPFLYETGKLIFAFSKIFEIY